MYQTFDVTTSPEQGPPRLKALRAAMKAAEVDGFLVPRADAHQGEYVAPCDERLAWLTGFTGSAGFAAVLSDVAGVFIDGRYRVQVRSQIADVFTAVHWPETQLADWLGEHLSYGAVVAFDPWLHTVKEIDGLRDKLAPKGITLLPHANLIDPIWTNRPAPPEAPFRTYPDQLAGETSAEKRARLTTDLESGATVLTLPDSIAWLLNIRGSDIERNPVPQAFALLMADGTVDLFARAGKADDITDHLGPDVRVHHVDSLIAALTELSGPVRIDPASCPLKIAETLSEAELKVTHAKDPCLLPKAIKNDTEIAGARAAHLRDEAAMVRFLAWLDTEAPKGNLTEIDVVTQLETFRRETNLLLDISFETISGVGEHGAIVHYRVSKDTNAPVKPGELLLVDSGGQYLDGTTDITRTIAIGDATPDQRSAYTRVLQGMIAISRAQFPMGVGGQHLDALARYPLWLAGMDYDHGTGHGVGAYLSVHEGPQGISRRSEVPFEAGMILSNEPGYYREGAFGIRLENLIVVNPAAKTADHRKMHSFETLTYVPLDRRLIDTGILTVDERSWVDSYHAETLDKIGPSVEGAAKVWLIAACAPLEEEIS